VCRFDNVQGKKKHKRKGAKKGHRKGNGEVEGDFVRLTLCLSEFIDICMLGKTCIEILKVDFL